MKKIFLIIILLSLSHLSKAQEFSIEAVNSYTLITSPTASHYFDLYFHGLKAIIPSYGLELSYKNKTNSKLSYSLGTSFGSKNLISVPFYVSYNLNNPIISSVGLGLNYFHRDDNTMWQKAQIINDIQMCARLKKDFTLSPKFQAGVSMNFAYSIKNSSCIAYSSGRTYTIIFHYLLIAPNFSIKYNF